MSDDKDERLKLIEREVENTANELDQLFRQRHKHDDVTHLLKRLVNRCTPLPELRTINEGGTPRVLNGQVETPSASNLPPSPAAPTPRTDRMAFTVPAERYAPMNVEAEDISVVPVLFARQLERELAFSEECRRTLQGEWERLSATSGNPVLPHQP